LQSIEYPRLETVTIGHLLSMRAGLESTSFQNYGRWVTSRDWVRHALARPFVAEPGGRMIYSTGNTHLLSAILTRATGTSTWAFARRRLAEPLGMDLPRWQRDPQGIYFGGNNMMMRPRDMLRLGELYRNGGRHEGRQIVPEEWVRASWTPRTVSPWNGHRYGYGCWVRRVRGHSAYFAWGYGGQYIFVLPELDLTVVMTSDPTGRARGYRSRLHSLLAYRIIPALKPAEVSGSTPPLRPLPAELLRHPELGAAA
jgi:CubicO group peptidase (beta-lactamase class C family)